MTTLIQRVEKALEESKVANNIATDAFVVEFETVWGDPNNVRDQLTQTIASQKRWFTQLKDEAARRKPIEAELLKCVEALKSIAPSWLPEEVRNQRREALANLEKVVGRD